jgi:hypothetical protein
MATIIECDSCGKPARGKLNYYWGGEFDESTSYDLCAHCFAIAVKSLPELTRKYDETEKENEELRKKLNRKK